MLSSIRLWILRIKDNKRLMRRLRLVSVIADLLLLIVPLVLFRFGIIGAAPTGALTMLSILNITLFFKGRFLDPKTIRTPGDQLRVRRTLPDEENVKPLKQRPPARTRAASRKPPWES